MKTTVLVDEVGRMVLPKSVRDAIGICGRTSVNVEVVAGAAQISPLEARVGPVARRRGRTLYTGPLPSQRRGGFQHARTEDSEMKRFLDASAIYRTDKGGACGKHSRWFLF
jgi:bifunctional DNA-binding transcriptional regulator/antitoxin component of YhaV-PrlF toxin-antitoxin module